MNRPLSRQASDALIATVLESRERILWQGQPDRAFMLLSRYAGTTVIRRLALLVLAFALLLPVSLGGLYVASMAVRAVSGLPTIGQVLACLLGIGLAVAPWFLSSAPARRAWRRAPSRWYVVTNQRVLILQLQHGAVDVRYVRQLRQISAPRITLLWPGGVGDVVFGAGGDAGAGNDSSYVHFDIGFDAVPDAEGVHQRLLAAKAQAHGVVASTSG